MRFNILINTVEDVMSLVDKVSQYDCDVELISGCCHVDAKSILGVLGIGVNKELIMIVHDEPNDEIRDDLQRFIA